MTLENADAHTPAAEEDQKPGTVVCKSVEEILLGVQKLFETIPLEGTLPKGQPIPQFTFQAIVRNYLERGSIIATNQEIYTRPVPGGILEIKRKRMMLLVQEHILEEISEASRTPITVSEKTPVILTLSRVTKN